MPSLLTLALVFLIGGAMIFPLLNQISPPTDLRDYCVEQGAQETGAWNLVSAIYLGYRAYDTLGETIVLLLAVTGALFLIKGEE